MRHVANKLKMTLAALVSACMLLTGVPAVAFAAAGEAATDAVGSLGDAIETLAADADADPAITPLADEEPDYSVTTVVFELTDESYLQPTLCFSKRESTITVDWGDGTTSSVSSGTSSTNAKKSSDYASTGMYTVTISSTGTYWLGGGSSSSYAFIASNCRSSATSIVVASNAVPQSCSFYGCSNLATLDLSACNTSSVTDMRYMFYGCSALIELDLSEFDTSNVKYMQYMFDGCTKLANLDVSGFGTSQVTNMSYMFYNCSDLQVFDVSCFDISKATDMNYMFYGCKNLGELDVKGFNTSNVTNMSGLFDDCSGLTELDVSGFDTSNVTNMSSMFYGCSGLAELDVSGFDTSKATSMSSMFYGCSGLTKLDVSGFDTSNVTNMSSMFNDCSGLAELDVSGFDTANVTDMSYMFDRCESLVSLDLSSFDTSAVTNMQCMISSYYSSSSNSATLKLETLDISGFDTSKVTNMSYMFYGCTNLTELDVSGFDTSNVTTMYGMFWCCGSLTSLDLSSFVTSKVTSMYYMFKECSSLTSLDLSGFDTSQVTSHSGMFSDCTQLREATLADTFTFGTDLPTPSSKVGYEATGKWVDIATGEAYVPADIPNDTAATYYAQATETPLTFGEDDFTVAVTAGFTGTEIVPFVATDLLEGTEYVVSYDPAGDWSIEGTVTLTITGVGNYAGSSVVKQVTLVRATPPVKTPTLLQATYGDTLADVKLPKEELGTWSWEDDSQSVGDAGVQCFSAVFTPDDTDHYFIFQDSLKVTVWRKSIQSTTFTIDTSNEEYTGTSITKELTGTDNDRTLVEETDFVTRYSCNIKVGTAGITIQGIGNYRGEALHYDFNITQRTLDKADFSVEETEATYTGSDITPSVLPAEGLALVEGTDYTISYSNNTKAGTASITVSSGDSGNCKNPEDGPLTYTFNINPKSIECKDVVYVVDTDPVTYTGVAIAKEISGSYNEMELVEGSDYTVTYANNTDAGTATITITGMGNYTGKLTYSFTIKQRELSKDDFEVNESSVAYTGKAVSRPVSVNKESCSLQDSDYSVTRDYEEAVNVGTYTITVAAVDGGNCTDPEGGPLTYSFTITPCELDSSKFSVSSSGTYTGSDLKPSVSVRSSYAFVEGTDYTVSYLDANGHEVSQFVDAGDYTVRVSAAGSNCTGTVDFAYTIGPRSISSTSITIDTSSVEFTGAPITKEITITYNGVKLVEGIDYTVVYEDNVNVSRYSYIDISGIGNFSGTTYPSFRITAHALSKDDFTVDESTKTYTGAAITKQVDPTGSLVEGRDYFVSYESNTEVGTAVITIDGDGTNCTGSLEYHFTITSNYLTTSSFKVDTSDAAYTGSPITKKITPVDSLVEGRDYVVAYANNTQMGTATIVITGINNCFGQVTYTFKIVGKQTIKLAKKKVTVKAGKKVKVKVKGAKTSLVAKPKGKKAKKALKVKVKGKKKLIVKAKPNAKRGTYKVKVYAKQAGYYQKSKTLKLKVKVK